MNPMKCLAPLLAIGLFIGCGINGRSASATTLDLPAGYTLNLSYDVDSFASFAKTVDFTFPDGVPFVDIQAYFSIPLFDTTLNLCLDAACTSPVALTYSVYGYLKFVGLPGGEYFLSTSGRAHQP